MRNLDLRVTQVSVDDYNPELLVRAVSAKSWPFTSHGVFNLPASNDQIASSFQPGLNSMACKMDNWRPKSGASNPISCSFTMNGSYRTEGACLSDLTRAPVVGKVEKINNKHLYGWACLLGSAQSIDVHLYVGGASGAGGTYVQAKTANEGSGDSVKNYCKSTGTKHRFKIDLRPLIAQHKGKSIYVHGICPAGSPAGCANDFISRSGSFSIPQR
jgi:hypothetical protein